MKDDSREPEVAEGDKGKLLWEEREVDLDKRKRDYMLSGLGWVALWTFVMFWAYLADNPFVILTLPLIFVGFLMVYWGLGLLPNRIYGNGLEFGMEFPPFLTEKRTFVSWGECAGLREIEKEVIFICPSGRFLRLRRDVFDPFGTIEDLKERIGKTEYKVLIDAQGKTKKSRTVELALYPTAIIATILLTLWAVISIYHPTPTLSSLILSLAVGVPPFSIILLGFFLGIVATRRVRFGIKLKINLRRLVAVFIVLNIIFLTTLSFGIWAPRLSEPITSYDFRRHSRPSNYWQGGLSFENGIYYMNETLYVPGDEQAKITNSTLKLMGGGIVGIYVSRGASLKIVNSTLTSQDPWAGFWFEVYGELFVYGSKIKFVWGNVDFENFDGGIELYGADATFESSSIENCETNGILADDSSLSVRNCVVQNCWDDGIELHGTSAKIQNSSILYNGWPIMFWHGSDAEVTDCLFEGNREGCYIAESSPNIKNCMFRDTERGAAIVITGYSSNPTLEENTFENNDADVGNPATFPYELCMVILPIFSLGIIGILYSINKKIIK